ncbi:MAG TPA: RluA family pseudouridine synthase [bacterium]
MAVKYPSEITIKILQDDSGERLDKFLALKLKRYGITRARVQRMLEDGLILVDNNQAKQSGKLKGTELVSVKMPEPSELELIPEDSALNIIYEDADIIVLNKSEGIVVHPSPGHLTGTLVNRLIAYTKALSATGGPLRPGIVHRLDKDTSGVMVIARNDIAYNNLTEQFAGRKIKKVYRCIVSGSMHGESGKIEESIGRSFKDRKKISSRTRHGRHAITEWRVHERFDGFTHLGILIHTGRTHQIRVHLSENHHPVLGDRIYGGKLARNAPLGIDTSHLYLHSEILGFTHPRTGDMVEFSAPLPPYFLSTVEMLRGLH